VMAPMRMKLRARRRDNVAADEASPDSKCPICLDRFNNLAYLDRCLHRFCFPCIQEWSHNKAECPLCKQPFASILHSVRAEDDFKEYTLRPPPANSSVAATVAMVAAMASAPPNDRASRRLMTRLAARQRLQREGGTVRRLRERETVAFRRALYRNAIRVAGVGGNHRQQRDITAESFRRNPSHLNRLRPWLRRELTVLYGAHEEELRQFLLARTDHFLHELVSFARSPLSLESYDLQATYEPPDAAMELDGTSSSSDSSSVIAISEGEEEEGTAGGRSAERLLAMACGTHDDVVQAGSCLSLATWDDETPGPSYSTADPSRSLASPQFGHAPREEANEEEGGDKEECLIVGYKKPIAERTPELVQLSSDTEEEERKKTTEELPRLHSATPPLSYLPTIPPSTSGGERNDEPKEKDGSWSGSSGGNSVCALSPAAPGKREQRPVGDGKSGGEMAREEEEKKKKKKKKRRSMRKRRRGQERSGTLYNPNRSIYPAMMRHRSHSSSPFHSSVGSPDSTWEYHCAQVSPLTSSVSSPSRCSSSSFSSSSSQPPAPIPSLSPNCHHGEKPGGKRKYKSRHLDSDDRDPSWRPSSREKEARRRLER
uniref:E3 ubiquitin-protein ligase Topors n=1 Tax=Cyclopterus lumpus TaxID=8103 RepID=A0A8C2ZYV0_CYCLU